MDRVLVVVLLIAAGYVGVCAIYGRSRRAATAPAWPNSGRRPGRRGGRAHGARAPGDGCGFGRRVYEALRVRED